MKSAIRWKTLASLWIVLAVLFAAAGDLPAHRLETGKMNVPEQSVIKLPAPSERGRISLEEALEKRRSVRSFSSRKITADELSQLLWATQGKTRAGGGRTAPSAGALYPLEIYAVTEEGIFQYRSGDHSLVRRSEGDARGDLAGAALGQDCVRTAPVVFVIAGVSARTERKYGARAERYVKMEAGHAGQNLLLQAVSLGLGAVPVGAFRDDEVRRVLGLPPDQEPLYLIPVGYAR